MNVRQKLSLAAMCLTLPAMASAQAAAAPAAAPAAAAPAAAPAPAFEIKPYGFLLLTYHQSQGAFTNPEYPGFATSDEGSDNIITARQSRFGWNFNNGDGGFTGAKLGGRLEFDFMGPGIVAYNSAPVRLRYGYATAGWDLKAAGKVTLLVGQTDGLVNPLHPELAAYVATPMFLQAGNLFRRSPQIRASYGYSIAMVNLTAEVAALSAADAASATLSAGNNSGQPDLELRAQANVKPMKDISATVGFGYHTNKRLYPAVAGKAATNAPPAQPTAAVQGVEETEVTSTVMGIDFNVDVPYANVRGEWYTGEGADDIYTGAFTGAVALPASATATYGNDPTVADPIGLTKSNGYWVQATLKPIPQAWIFGGIGHAEIDQDTLPIALDKEDYKIENDMLNVGVLCNVSKNWKLGLEYTKTTTKSRKSTYTAATTTFATTYPEVEASQVAFSSRFSF